MVMLTWKYMKFMKLVFFLCQNLNSSFINVHRVVHLTLVEELHWNSIPRCRAPQRVPGPLETYHSKVKYLK